MQLNQFFDKIYCINLEQRKDKWDEVSQIFKKYKIEVERFEAINGAESGRTAGTPPRGWSPINQGNIGCILSHIEILNKAQGKVLILEDDVDFVDNFDRLCSTYLDNIPEDWDMVYFGGNYKFGTTEYFPVPINDYVGKAKLILGTHAVGINVNMQKGLASGLSGLEMPVDLYYSTYMAHCNCYTPNQNLAFQRPSFSDIEQKDVDYRHLYK